MLAAAGPKRQALIREQTTLECWPAVHNLLDHSVGLLDCSRRYGLKRFACAPEPDRQSWPNAASRISSTETVSRGPGECGLQLSGIG
jgi:hypothetical protein